MHPSGTQQTAVIRGTKINSCLFNADVLEVSPSSNNGTHGSMNHVLQQPYYTPVHPAEQSEPAQCPLVSLNPEDNLGCSCGEVVGTSLSLKSIYIK